ncbi:hypothetical protein HYFRA_00004311 [Hymenoscyphus fraxineus]|uniref:Uncharacterized protein n=1 Tax=Hymenoscyphus fraxineus TaxID=746836 RepID=A0A9N9KLL8_9HELO|nr:hypothetical protein HYFRA_00004311 [Hymenoscyphus fraxineus]
MQGTDMEGTYIAFPPLASYIDVFALVIPNYLLSLAANLLLYFTYTSRIVLSSYDGLGIVMWICAFATFFTCLLRFLCPALYRYFVSQSSLGAKISLWQSVTFTMDYDVFALGFSVLNADAVDSIFSIFCFSSIHAFMILKGAELEEILDYDNPSYIATAILLACSSCHGCFLYYTFVVIALCTRSLFIELYQKSANTYRNSLSQEQLRQQFSHKNLLPIHEMIQTLAKENEATKVSAECKKIMENELNPEKDNPDNVSEKLSANIKQLQLHREYIAYLEREIVSESKKNTFKAEDVKLDV